mmetsp:Transcript_51527/g.154706  ORF Transcript_51527/g.154706 Transcript_51527/m.154706 type:complete len:135 (-) Transcript_51527:7-411(-)
MFGSFLTTKESTVSETSSTIRIVAALFLGSATRSNEKRKPGRRNNNNLSVIERERENEAILRPRLSSLRSDYVLNDGRSDIDRRRPPPAILCFVGDGVDESWRREAAGGGRRRDGCRAEARRVLCGGWVRRSLT